MPDVYDLTIMWTLTVRDFAGEVISLASDPRNGNFSAENGASAAQMLVKCYNEEGLRTSRSQVLAFDSSSSQAIATKRTVNI